MRKNISRIFAGTLTASVLLTGGIVSAQAEEVSGTLTFLSWYNQSQFQPILDAFQEKYPDVEVDFQNVSTENNQYSQRLTLLANSGELPDVFYIQPPVARFAAAGYLAPLDDLECM